MQDNVIIIRGLSKKFGDLQVLENVDLDVKAGEKIAIIGGSGCGKSVFLRSIEMLTKPDSGSIYIYGNDICQKGTNIDLVRRNIGMVYQQFNLFEHMDVMDNLCLAPTHLLKMPRNVAEEKARELLKEVGLLNREHAWPKNLSGGQQQRIAIARCLMMEPKIMLLDEPTSALDPTMVGEVLATIRSLGKKGLTMLIVTHEMNFAKSFADRVLFFADKGIYEDGTPKEIFENPKREKTIQFIKKLKQFDYHIGSKKYDLMELAGGISSFCDRYAIDDKRAWRLQLCTEELIEALLNNIGEDVDINISIEYSEIEHFVTLKCLWKGVEYDLFANTSEDNLGLMILRNASKSILKDFSNGENKIEFLLT